jgi:hypothetical protein
MFATDPRPAGSRLAALAMLPVIVALLPACATPLQPPVVGYTCCNLRPVDGWISSDNLQGGGMIPPGQPVRLDSIKRSYYVYGTIGDQAFALRDDASRSEADTMDWVRRVVVAQDPNARATTWSPEIRAAVRYGRVLAGMTRAQVAMSLGYPSRNDTPDLLGSKWRYWTAAEDLPVDLVFDSAQRLAGFEGKPSAISIVEAERFGDSPQAGMASMATSATSAGSAKE